ncbi:MAG TPA: glycosyltransferase [Steroidobacteraceae bacterium]|nr:glycosyltransferase [Steroidobacteraceae bacterium]
MNAEIKQPGPAQSCWITWEVHRRSRSVTQELQIPLVEMSRPGRRAVRYTRNSLATLYRLIRYPQRTVFVQVPSLVLAHLVLALSAFLRFRVVVDAHNAVIEGAEHAPFPLGALYRFVVRKAHLVIVTNSSLAERVRKLGGRPGILPDPVPELQAADTQPGSHRAVVISTWAADEPLEAVLQAAPHLPQPLFFTITGRPRGPLAQVARGTERVELSGFVSEPDYLALLAGARVIVDLTTREDCLVCGAYEALALGRPLVVSDSQALRELLREGAVFARNAPEDIARAVAEASRDELQWSARCAARRDSYSLEWKVAAARLLGAIEAAPPAVR